MNSNTIANGVVATLSVTLSSTATSTSLGVANALGSTVSGSAYAVSGSGGTVAVPGSTVYHVSSLLCNPATLSGTGSSTCTVTLDTVAPSGGAAVGLSSDNSNLTVPGSVSVPGGSASVNFSAAGSAVTANQTATIMATANGTAQTFAVSLVASTTTTISSLQCSPTTLASNASGTCTVTLSKPAPSSGASVALSKSAGLSGLTVPGSISVAANAATASFTISTGSVSLAQTGSLTASYNGSSRSVSISVGSSAIGVSSLQCSPTTLGSNSASTCAVTLLSATLDSVTITLATTLSNVTLPASIVLPGGSTTGTFTVQTSAVSSNQSGTVTASYGGSSQSVTLNLTGSSMVISSLQCSPATLSSNSGGTCTVTLSSPAPATGASVSLSNASNGNAISAPTFTMPSSVMVSGNSTTVSFAISTGSITADQSVSLAASYNGSSKIATISLVASTTVSSLQCNPTTLGTNASSNCTVALSKADPSGGVAVILSSSGLSSLTVPPSVTVTAGSTTGPFIITTGSFAADQNGSLTATYNGTSQTVNLSLAAAIAISSLQCNPTTLSSNSSSNCSVSLSKAAPAGGVVVTLASSGFSSLTVPPSVSVTAGSTTGPFSISTGAVGTDQNGSLTASYNGTSKTVNLSLAAATVLSALECDFTTLGANASSNCTVTLSKAAPGGGAAVMLSSSGLSGLRVPEVVTVTAGSTTGLFAVTTGSLFADQNGSLAATYNGTAESVNFSLVMATVISSLQCSPTTLGSNATSDCTVTLSKPAPTGGAVVTLSSNGLPGLAVPASMTVAAGSAIGLFTLTTGPLSSNQNGSVTASYSSTSQTVNFSLAATQAISSLQCMPAILGPNTTADCTVTLSKAIPDAAVVTLSSSGLSALKVPASVSVTAGSTTAAFTVSTGPLSTSQAGTLTAALNGTSKTVNLTLSTTLVVAALQCSPTTLASNSKGTCTVTLSAPAIAEISVKLNSQLRGLEEPRSVAVPAGSRTGVFPISTGIIRSSNTGDLTASYNGSSKSVILTVKP